MPDMVYSLLLTHLHAMAYAGKPTTQALVYIVNISSLPASKELACSQCRKAVARDIGVVSHCISQHTDTYAGHTLHYLQHKEALHVTEYTRYRA